MTDPYRAQGAQSTALLQTASAAAAPALALASALAALATVAWWQGQHGKTLAIDAVFTEPAQMGQMLTALLHQLQPPPPIVTAAIRVKIAWHRHCAGQPTVASVLFQDWCRVIAAFATDMHAHVVSRGDVENTDAV